MAVEGKKKVVVDREEIFSKIGSYDVYMLYMPWKFTLNQTCRNPFVSEKHASFIIGNKFGEVTHKAFNSPHRGDCISFVMDMFGLTYLGALEKIARDFGLLEKGSEEYKRIISTYEKPKGVKPPVLIQAKSKPFGEEHKKYLSQFHLAPSDLNFCKDTKCVAVKEWALNRAKMPLKTNEVAFAYNLKNIRGNWLKIYRPEAGKDQKWWSSIPFTEMHGLDNMRGCDLGIITKSIKDGAFLAKYITPCVCVVQAEDYTAISEENMQFINENCKRVYVSWDNDKKGVEACQAITKQTGWRYINPPKELIPKGVTDMSDMGKLLGPEAVIEFFKQKGVI